PRRRRRSRPRVNAGNNRNSDPGGASAARGWMKWIGARPGFRTGAGPFSMVRYRRPAERVAAGDRGARMWPGQRKRAAPCGAALSVLRVERSLLELDGAASGFDLALDVFGFGIVYAFLARLRSRFTVVICLVLTLST